MKSFCKILILVQLFAISACSQQVESSKAPDSENITIQNYQQCVKLGGIMLKTYPAKCRTKNGQTFTRDLNATEPLCNNLCGDGLCAELVCQGQGCPCTETKENCPNDCP